MRDAGHLETAGKKRHALLLPVAQILRIHRQSGILRDLLHAAVRDEAERAIRLRQLDADADVDLVITDLNMPQMDGMELMKAIKSEHPDLPVVVITGYGTFNTEKQVLSNGIRR